MFGIQQLGEIRVLGGGRAKGAHNCLPAMKCDTLEIMGSQACMLADQCYKCGGGNINCQWQTSGGLCKPSRAQTAPWLLDLQDAKQDGIDLPSKLSLAMDCLCFWLGQSSSAQLHRHG